VQRNDWIYDWNLASPPLIPPGTRVLLNDETLRDGLQNPSVYDPSIDEKIRLLHLMESLGIDSVNIGLPGAGPRAAEHTEALAREIATNRMKIRPNCAARTVENDIRPIVEISQRSGIAIEAATFLGSSPIRRLVEDWTVDHLERTTESAVKFAISHNLPSMYVTEDPSSATITVRGKYFFDPTFGGALIPGQRNQFYPIDTFSGFSYGGVPRRFSPINLETRYRPRRSLEADVQLDFDVSSPGLRDLSVAFGLNRHLFQFYQSFYYTRAIILAPSLARFGVPFGVEPGTQNGSQWSPSVFLGNRDRGLFGGASVFFDFQNRPQGVPSSLVSSTVTLGYTWDCCAVTGQYYTFNVGLRKENRVVFAFRLNGIGTFGTEQLGQKH